MKLAAFNQLDTAIALLRRGMHVSIVSRITHINPKILRPLVREIHGKRPVSGQMTSISGILRTRAVQASASVFAVLYRASGGSGIFDRVELKDFLAAYDLYLELAGEIAPPNTQEIPINITQAWVIARDIQTGAAYFQSCRRCHIQYLLADDSRLPPSCPICALNEAGSFSKCG